MSRKLILVALGLCAALPALAGKKDKPSATSTPTLVPLTGVYVRAGFDGDPSPYLGRMVPDSVVVPDESGATTTPCSSYVTYKPVPAGNVKYDQLMVVNDNVGASIGVPMIAQVDFGHQKASVVRFTYTLTNKMVGTVADPQGFQKCCAKSSTQCSERYVSEFWEGKGSMWFATGVETGGKADATIPVEGVPVSVSLEAKHGYKWQRSIEFEDSPVYFAFKTSPSPRCADTVVAGCGAWVDTPPESACGQNWVGVSQTVGAEQTARDAAMDNGREQVVEWLGEQISTGKYTQGWTSGDVEKLKTKLADESFVERAASGLAKHVKDKNYCVKTEATPDGTRYQAWVLAFLDEADATEASEVVRDTLETPAGETPNQGGLGGVGGKR